MNDQTTASKRAPRKGKFFIIESSYWSGGKVPGIEISNKDRLWAPGWAIMLPPNGDPNQYSERPHLIQLPEKGGMPRDMENLAGIWIISARLKNVFESFDPEGFAFAECDFTLADGTPGPQRYLCGVTRTLNALDEEASRLKIVISNDYQNGKHYSLAGGVNLVFKETIIGVAHIFRTPFSSNVFCDQTLKDAVNATGLKGVWFADAAGY